MPPRRNAGPPPNIAPIIVGVGFIGMGVAFYFGFPGVGVMLLALMFAGWSSVPPIFTGKKDSQGRPTAIDDGEKRMMNSYRFWSDLKWRLLIPNGYWLPGMNAQRPQRAIEHFWTPNLVWIIASALGILALGIPVRGPVELLGGSAGSEMLFRLIDGFSLFSIIVVATTAARANFTPDDPRPGITLKHAMGYLGTPKGLPLFFAGGILSGIAATAVFVYGGTFDLGTLIAPLPVPVVAIAVFFLLYALVLFLGSRNDALEHWRLVASKRPEWEQRWAPVLKSSDEAPRLVDFEQVGFFEVSTFDASASMGYGGVLSMESKIAPALGAGRMATILSSPDIDSSGQPMPGTINPRRFRVVTYPSDELVDFTDVNADPKVIEIGADVAMMRVIVANGLGRPVFMDVSPAFTIPDPIEPDEEDEPEDADGDGTPDEPETKRKWWQRRPRVEEQEDEQPVYTGSWLAHWAVPNGPPFSFLADYADDIGAEAGTEVTIDKRNGDIFFGALSDETTPWTNPANAKRVKNIALDNVWYRRWKNVFQGKIEFIPRREAELYGEAKIGDITIYRQPFSMGQGVELKQYDRLEDKLAVALDSAPMVAITGFKSQGDREGARHPQGMCVVWSPSAQVPSSPERLKPGSRANANEWVLTWMLNRAFDHTKRLARPEIISTKCLTSPDSSGHIWEMKLRLYGGVTLEEVRTQSERIRQSMAASWIRVIEDAYGCTIAVGVKPNAPGVKLSNPRTADRIAELNWEQAFAISGVSGHGGVLPKMVNRSVMEKNKNVSVLDFTLPAGCEIENVKKVIGKLSPATDNAFLQINPTDDPKVIRILAAERNPLEKSYAPDWDEIDESDGIPFATGVDGASMVFSPKKTPHCLVSGLSGGGKSVLVQGLVYGALIRGWDLAVIDPVKGGADFKFAEDYIRAMAIEKDDFFAAAGLMKLIYAEVARRVRMNSKHGVASFADLPEDIRPNRILLIIDEFTSAIEQEKVPPRSDDAELEAERDAIIALNNAKLFIAQFTGKILREARSAGVTVILATQKLSAKSLDAVPGGETMKMQLSRILLGNATFADKMSALRKPEASPDLGTEVPPGRGIYEPSDGGPQIIQAWYSPTREFREKLEERAEPIGDEGKWDYSGFITRPEDGSDEEELQIPDAFDSFGDDFQFTGFAPEEEGEVGAEFVAEKVGEEVAFSLDAIIDGEFEATGSLTGDGFADEIEEPFEPEAVAEPEVAPSTLEDDSFGDDVFEVEPEPVADDEPEDNGLRDGESMGDYIARITGKPYDPVPDTSAPDHDEMSDQIAAIIAADAASRVSEEPVVALPESTLPVVVEDGDSNVVAEAANPGRDSAPLGVRGPVFITDVDGVLAPFSPTANTTDREVSGMGVVHLDAASARRMSLLPVTPVFVTDWERELVDSVFTPLFKRVVDYAPNEGSTEYWWKIETIMRLIDDNPEITSVIWVDDLMGRGDEDEEKTRREQFLELMDIVDIPALAVQTDSHVGLTDADWANIEGFLGLAREIEQADGSTEDAIDFTDVVFTDDPVEEEDDTTDEIDFSQVVALPAPPPVDDDDPFADVAPARVVKGRIGNTGQVEGGDDQ